MSRTLAYGDIIRIYCSLQDNQEGGNKTAGFLMSKGFADTNIYFLKSKEFTEFELRNSLFEILPYSSFEIHDEAKKQKAESKNGHGGITESVKSSMKTEEEQFKSKIAKERTFDINFDSEVVIRHVNSDNYLQGQFSCPETGIGSFKLILSIELSSDVKFKITRFRNSDKEAEQIQSKDEFILYHCSSHCYLNIGDLDEKVFLDKEISTKNQSKIDPVDMAKQDNEAYKFINERPLIKRPNRGSEKIIQRHQVVNMSKPTLILNFLLERSSKDDMVESEIQHNDVVYIRNTKNMSYLTADLWSGQVSLVSYTGSRSGDFPYEGIWEICVPRDPEKGQVTSTGTYYLKHYTTDKICEVETDGEKLKRVGLDSDMTFNKTMNAFKIANYHNKKTLNHRDLIFLQVCNSEKQDLLHNSPLSSQNKVPSHSFLDIGNKIQKIFLTKLQEKCEEECVSYSMEMTQGPLVNAFQIFKLEDKKLKQVNKILSCVEILTNFCDVLIVLDNTIREEIGKSEFMSKQPEPTMNESMFNTSVNAGIDESIKNTGRRNSMQASEVQESSSVEMFLTSYLNYYILNLVTNTIEYLVSSIKKTSKKPDFQFMMMIRSLGVIEILIEAIFFIERNLELIIMWESRLAAFIKKKKYFKDRLDNCFKLIYSLLLELSNENSCRLYLGRWFSMFMNQFYKLRLNDIHALIVALLKEKFIIKTLDQSYISECIRKMEDVINTPTNYKYLELLSSFCRAKNTAIEKNQRFVMSHIRNQNKLFYKFTKKQKESKEEIYVEDDKKSSLELCNYKRNNWENYIIFLLNLYADLMFDYPREDDDIREVKERISMDTVKTFFNERDDYEDDTDKKDNVSLFDSFLKLAHYFFLNELNHCKNPPKLIGREETLYLLTSPSSDTYHKKESSSSISWKNYEPVVTFIIDRLITEHKEKDYNASRLKTIYASLDFVKTISRLDIGDQNIHNTLDQIIMNIISVVVKLKRELVYKNLLKPLPGKDETPTNRLFDDLNNSKTEAEKVEVIKKIDEEIARNIKVIIKEKSQERLLIDSRSAADEILNIKLNILINSALKDLNKFFTDVCDNKIHIESYNKPEPGRAVSSFGEHTHWIWINKIKSIAENSINTNLVGLVGNDANGKKILVKLLIECIFVDSLKIVNKIMMLIFRLYELRKTLLNGFRETFVVVDRNFEIICEENIKLIVELEKIKPGGDYNKLMGSLETTNFAIRYFDNEKKLETVIRLYQLRGGDRKENESQINRIVQQLRKGLSDYIVLSEKETRLTTNQTLLQKMIANQKIHSYVITYAKSLKDEMSFNNNHLSIIYEFLTLLVYNNTRNKKLFSKDIRFVLPHLIYNCKAIEFLKKVVAENQTVINNRDLVNDLVVGILEAAHLIEEEEDKLIIKAKLIDSLRVFCIYDNKTHTENQSLIMIHMQNKKYENTIMFSTLEYGRNKFLSQNRKSLIEEIFNIGHQDNVINVYENTVVDNDDYQDCFEDSENAAHVYQKTLKILEDFDTFREEYVSVIRDNSEQINIPPRLLYLSSYFSTMSALVENNHEINKGKCCNIHPLTSLVALAEDANRCWPLIRHVRAYIIRLYFSMGIDKKSFDRGNSMVRMMYSNTNHRGPSQQLLPAKSNAQLKETQIEVDILNSKLFPDEIKLLIDRLDAINNELLKDESPLQNIKISTPIRYQYMKSYVYCCLQQILYEILVFFTGYDKCILQSDTITKKKFNNKDDPASLRRLFVLLGQTYQLLKKRKNDSFIRVLMRDIFEKCINVVRIIDFSHENEYEYSRRIKEREKMVEDISKSEEDFAALKNNYNVPGTKDFYEFMVYYFFLSEVIESRNNINIRPDKLITTKQVEFAPKREETEVKSFVRRLVPHNNDMKDDVRKELITELESTNKQIRVNKLLEVITNSLAEKVETQWMVQEELDELVQLCSSLDKEFVIPGFRKPNNVEGIEYRVIGYNVFMMNIISLVTKSPFHLSLEGKIKTIGLIRLIFEEKVNSVCKNEDRKKEWDSGFFQGDKLILLQQIQIDFRKLNLDKMIVAILQEENQSYALLLQTFKLGIKFLFNGNSECQTAILTNLQQDPENMVMCQLFNFIKKMRSEISQGKFIIKKDDESKNQTDDPLKNLYPSMLMDCYRFFDEDEQSMVKLGTEKDSSQEEEQEIEVKIQCVCYAYQFLQLMCENDNQTCKNFLRQQTNLSKLVKYNSINFVSETTKLFKVVLENYDAEQKQNIILRYLADFFIEVTQLPCTENQLELCATSIFSDIKSHIPQFKDEKEEKRLTTPRGKTSPESQNYPTAKLEQDAGPEKAMCYLMDFVVNASLSLLQGSSNEIYNSLISSLDERFLYKIFDYQRGVLRVLNQTNPECPLIHEFNDETLKILMIDENGNNNTLVRKRIYMVYNLFALIKKLSKYMSQKKEEHNDSTLIEKLRKYAEGHQQREKHRIKNTELFEPGHKIIDTFCREKLKHIQVVFQQKKQYLYFPDLPVFKKLSEETKQEMLEKVKRETQVDKITDFLLKSSEFNNLMKWNYKVESRLALSIKTLESIRLNILLLTLVIVSLYIMFTSVSFIKVHGKKEMLKNINNHIIDSLVNFLCIVHLFSSIYFMFTWCTLKYRMPVERELKEESEDREITKLLKSIDDDDPFKMGDYWMCFKLMLRNEPEVYNILYFTIVSFMGYFLRIEYYSLLAFDGITRNKILKNVIQAITSNIRQLVVVSLLILAFVYVFNIISIEFSLYLPLIYDDEDDKCTVLKDCVISLYTSGEIGEKHKEFKFTKFIADLLYIVIMQLLFSNIVSGIVIDTFAQLRDERKTIEIDTETKCFICGISKAALEKQLRENEDDSTEIISKENRFQDHTTNVHSQWNYIYYLYILNQKDITTYTGIEYFIKKQNLNDQYDWIPTHEEDDDREIKDILEITQQLVPKVKERLANRNELIN